MSEVALQPNQPPSPPARDTILSLLVAEANSVDHEDYRLPITLLVGGATVSGFLIPGPVYFRKYGEQLASYIDPNGPTIKDLYNEQAALVFREPDPAKTFFIHLAEAKVFHPGSRPMPVEGFALWRGRLSEVSGFALGGLSTD